MKRNDFENILLGFCQNVIDNESDDNYEVNRPQMLKLKEVYDFFMQVTDELGGSIDPVELSPKLIHGGLTATFTVFDVYGKSLERFTEILSMCSAVSIDATTDSKAVISVTVPSIFKHKPKN